jgi:hypothetical protein
MLSFVVGRKLAGTRPAADPGTRFAFASDAATAASGSLRDIV